MTRRLRYYTLRVLGPRIPSYLFLVGSVSTLVYPLNSLLSHGVYLRLSATPQSRTPSVVHTVGPRTPLLRRGTRTN